MPAEWGWLTGHLLVLIKYIGRLPSDANVGLALRDLSLEFTDTEILLVDFWPFYPAFFIVNNPEAAVQVSTKYNLPKPDIYLKLMHPITGGPSLVSMSNNEWKTWLSLFNPGFSVGSMMNLVPEIIDSVKVFCDILQERVGSGPFCLGDLTARLTMDVIIKVALYVCSIIAIDR
jgi:cytochrome P450